MYKRQYLAFSATNSSSSVFAVIDTVAKEQPGGFDSTGYFGVNVDESGIYVLRDNLLVKICLLYTSKDDGSKEQKSA